MGALRFEMLSTFQHVQTGVHDKEDICTAELNGPTVLESSPSHFRQSRT